MIGQITIVMLAGVCSKEAGPLCMAMERSANFSDKVSERRSCVRAEEERVKRDKV